MLANGNIVTLTSNGGSTDVFVLKLGSDGVAQWAASFGGSGFDYGVSIALDPSGASYVTGYFYGSLEVRLANGSTVTLPSNSGSQDIFVVKLDTAGGALWVRGFGGAGSDFGWGIAVDASGASLVTGQFTGLMSVPLANGTTITLTSNSFSADIFVLKLNTMGEALWARGFGGSYADNGYGIAVDAYGTSYTMGVGAVEGPAWTPLPFFACDGVTPL